MEQSINFHFGAANGFSSVQVYEILNTASLVVQFMSAIIKENKTKKLNIIQRQKNIHHKIHQILYTIITKIHSDTSSNAILLVIAT